MDSETMLYQLIKRIFPQQRVLRHYRPDWLQGLEIDIFLPELSLGVEYQGQQHFHPIAAWGGEKALERVQKRDKLKVEICKREEIVLVHIDYTEPLTQDCVKSALSKPTGN